MSSNIYYYYYYTKEERVMQTSRLADV